MKTRTQKWFPWAVLAVLAFVVGCEPATAPPVPFSERKVGDVFTLEIPDEAYNADHDTKLRFIREAMGGRDWPPDGCIILEGGLDQGFFVIECDEGPGWAVSHCEKLAGRWECETLQKGRHT